MFICRHSYDVGCIYMCADFVVVVGVLSHIASFRVLMTGVLWYRKFVCVCAEPVAIVLQSVTMSLQMLPLSWYISSFVFRCLVSRASSCKANVQPFMFFPTYPPLRTSPGVTVDVYVHHVTTPSPRLNCLTQPGNPVHGKRFCVVPLPITLAQKKRRQ